MGAITLTSGNLVNLSYLDDVLTIYPTFEYYNNPGLRNSLNLVLIACNEFKFVIKFLPDQTPTKENEKFVQCMSILQNGSLFYKKFVKRKDFDHRIYHRDDFKLTASHYHIKFSKILTFNDLNKVLDVLVSKALLSDSEKKLFLSNYHHRYAKVFEEIDRRLTKDSDNDTKLIINFIRQFFDNDILVNIHDYLLNDTFNYLREPNQQLTNNDIVWQGCDLQGEVKDTNKNWAMIEKAISLKMARNIQKGCDHFNQQIGHEKAVMLGQSYTFFYIKHKKSAGPGCNSNSVYRALDEGDGLKLAEKYSAFNGKYR